MKVSVLIPVIPNDPFIKKNLEALSKSTYKYIEIIVVDEGKERSVQRNIGIQKSTGECILYLDADQYVTPKLIEECVSLIKLGYRALYIPEKIITKGFFSYLRNWERQFYNSTPIDCVRFIKRDHCPLFDENQSGPEDSDHDRRVQGLRTITENYIHHDESIGLIKYLKKKAYYSKSMKKYSDRNPNDKCLNFWWRCFFVYIEDSKWKRLVSRPDLAICLFTLVFLRGVIYLWNR